MWWDVHNKIPPIFSSLNTKPPSDPAKSHSAKPAWPSWQSLQSFHYGHQSISEKNVAFTFRQKTKAIRIYQEREVLICICEVWSLPLSPGLPGWPGLPGKPCMPGDPCSPCGPGAPGRPGSPGGPAMVRVETDWLGIWFRIELYLAICPVRKKKKS